MGQLHSAGISSSDALPLVPLQQILMLGMQLAVVAVVAAPFAIAVSWLGIWAMAKLELSIMRRWRLFDAEGDVASNATGWQQVLRIATMVLVALGLLYLVLRSGAFPDIVVAFFGAAVALRFRNRPPIAAVIVYVFCLAAVTLSSYLHPAPLPSVILMTTDGHRIAGRLIAVSDGAWLVTLRPKRFEAIPSNRVASAVTTSVDSPPERSAWQVLEQAAR